MARAAKAKAVNGRQPRRAMARESKGGWTSAMVKACFGCGGTTHMIQYCPRRTTQKVQEVRDETDEPENMFIGHTSMTSDQELWHQVTRRRKMCKRLQCATPPGLENEYEIQGLDEDEEDEDDEETRHVRAVDSCDLRSWCELESGEEKLGTPWSERDCCRFGGR